MATVVASVVCTRRLLEGGARTVHAPIASANAAVVVGGTIWHRAAGGTNSAFEVLGAICGGIYHCM